MKWTLVFLLLLPSLKSFSQKQYIEDHEFVGAKASKYIYFQFGSRRGIPKPHLIYYQLQDREFTFEKAEPWTDKSKGVPIYVNGNLEMNDLGASKIKIKAWDKDSIYNFPHTIDFFGNKFLASSPNSDTVFISAHSEAPIYLFNKKTFEFTPLPLTGSNLHIRGDYLFFEAPRYSDNYSSFPKDVYRARLDDLKNPEKVLIQVNKWYPYTENVLYASTDPFLRLDGEQTYGFYNLKDQTVAQSPGIATQDIIEIKGEPYLLKIAEKGGEKTFKLEELPQLPQSFPYKILETGNQQPRGTIFQWHNIPLKEKTLSGTFVTHDLLYEAPASELKKLSREQLRILRNTFYAFQGYQFSSADLNNFFNQFDWYKKMSIGEKSNEDVVIWPDEKLRVDLIMTIEDSK
jgi:hypothetical protein